MQNRSNKTGMAVASPPPLNKTKKKGEKGLLWCYANTTFEDFPTGIEQKIGIKIDVRLWDENLGLAQRATEGTGRPVGR